MRDTPIGGKPDPAPIAPLPPLFPIEALLRQVRLVHVAFVIVIIGLGTAWGLKLEYRMDRSRAEHEANMERIAELERTVARGILPLAEERIARIAARVESGIGAHDQINARIDAMEARFERHLIDESRRSLEMERGMRRPRR